MTLHTPVVVTDDKAVAAAARSRRWPVVHRVGETLHLTGVDQVIPLPENSMQIEAGSLSGAHVAGWSLVLDWLEKHLHRPMMVVQPHGWAQDLALWSASSRSWPLAAWIHGEQPVVATAGAVALVGAARGVLFLDAGVRQRFIASWHSTIADLPSAVLINVDDPAAPTPSTRRDGVIRVLLVAYYAGDNPKVGVERPTYWFDMLEELSGGDITVDLATAAPWQNTTGRVHHVQDLGPATLAPNRDSIETWATVTFGHAANEPYAPTRQVGGYWHVALEQYFAARDDHYDVVIITGSPCDYFGFAAWAQGHWYARTLLDYREPFALNPRRTFTKKSRAQAIDWEKGWNMAADVITIAHAANRNSVVPSGPDMRIEVVRTDDATIRRFLADCDAGPHGPSRVEPLGRRTSALELVSLVRELGSAPSAERPR